MTEQEASTDADPFALGLALTFGSEPHETAHLPNFYRGPIPINEQVRITKLCLNRYFAGKGVGYVIFDYYVGVLADDFDKRV